MRLISILFTVAFVAFFTPSMSQQSSGFQKVDDFRIKDAKVKVYFKDPLAALMAAFPDFDKKPDPEKNKLLQVYLLNHELYLFTVTSKGGKVTSYTVRGNPEKKETSYRYRLDISDGDVLSQENEKSPVVRKTINDLNIGGEFFEHMAPFRQSQFKKVKTTQVWGNIIHINPYGPIKETIEKVIVTDQLDGGQEGEKM